MKNFNVLKFSLKFFDMWWFLQEFLFLIFVKMKAILHAHFTLPETHPGRMCMTELTPAKLNRVARNWRQFSSNLTISVITTSSSRTAKMVSRHFVIWSVNENLRSQICSTQILWFSKFWRVFHARHQPESCCRSRSGTSSRCWTAWRRGWTTSSRSHQPESKPANSWQKQRLLIL